MNGEKLPRGQDELLSLDTRPAQWFCFARLEGTEPEIRSFAGLLRDGPRQFSQHVQVGPLLPELQKRNFLSTIRDPSGDGVRLTWLGLFGECSTDSFSNFDPVTGLAEEILLVPIAFWLAGVRTLSAQTVIQLVRVEGRDWVRSYDYQRSESNAVSGEEGSVDEGVFAAAQRLHHRLLHSESQRLVTALAIETLREALHQIHPRLRFLILWLALEALYGPSGGGELKYRISLRIGLFLGSDRKDAHGIAERARKLYDVRSAIAHGQLPRGDLWKTLEHVEQLEDLVRRSLSKLLNENLVELFDDRDEREKMLEGLVFKPD